MSDVIIKSIKVLSNLMCLFDSTTLMTIQYINVQFVNCGQIKNTMQSSKLIKN